MDRVASGAGPLRHGAGVGQEAGPHPGSVLRPPARVGRRCVGRRRHRGHRGWPGRGRSPGRAGRSEPCASARLSRGLQPDRVGARVIRAVQHRMRGVDRLEGNVGRSDPLRAISSTSVRSRSHVRPSLHDGVASWTTGPRQFRWRWVCVEGVGVRSTSRPVVGEEPATSFPAAALPWLEVARVFVDFGPGPAPLSTRDDRGARYMAP